MSSFLDSVKSDVKQHSDPLARGAAQCHVCKLLKKLSSGTKSEQFLAKEIRTAFDEARNQMGLPVSERTVTISAIARQLAAYNPAIKPQSAQTHSTRSHA